MATKNSSTLNITWRSCASALAKTALRISDADMSLRCAGVAFFSFLSLFPAAAVGVSLYGLFADLNTLNRQMYLADQFLPTNIVELFGERLQAIIVQSNEALTWGLIISTIFALWSGSRGINALIHAMTVGYRETKQRGFLISAVVSIFFTVAAFIVGLFVLGAVAIIPAALAILPLPLSSEDLALWVRWPILILIVLAAVAILYKAAPHRPSEEKYLIVPGAIVASFLWLSGSIAFSFYIENFSNYGATFGSIATAAVLMLWLYFSSMVFVAGAIFNAELAITAVVAPNPN
ncbi:MAG: YihY/virulence factor BrkB family protein [Hyphomicrobiales bacterium]